jgi:hypothetical protein
MTEQLDPAIYSDQYRYETGPDGESHLVPLTWRQVAEDRAADLSRLQPFVTLINDLDRNPNGRHEGDADVGDPTGVSHGNPRLRTGDVLGWDIGGTAYVMPPRGLRHDPTAWRSGR